MSGRRIYDNATVERVKAAVADGRRIRDVAADYGMSPSTVSNMVRGRIYRPLEEVKAEQRTRAEICRVAAQAQAGHRRAEREAEKAAVPRGVVERAKAELTTGKPLVVETLEQRLEKAIPGATLRWQLKTWAVWGRGARLSTAESKREAIDKAIALFGGQR